MKKTQATILNAIPSNMDLETYFESLDVFDKRALLDELEICKGHFTKNLKRNTVMVLISDLTSFLCYFGIREEWFIYYLFCINIPMSIFLFLTYRSASIYYLAIEKLKKSI